MPLFDTSPDGEEQGDDVDTDNSSAKGEVKKGRLFVKISSVKIPNKNLLSEEEKEQLCSLLNKW